MKYSIIYASIRPDITERLSIGIVIFGKERVKVKYSDKKIRLLKLLFTDARYKAISKTVKLMDGRIKSEGDIDYLSRYSNNFITVSNLRKIDLEPTKQNERWLYAHYVYKKQR